MYIGLISDTHGHLPAEVHRLFSGCDLILHAGDIGSPAVLEELELIAPVRAVLGNNDYPADFPGLDYEQRNPDAAELDYYMAHTPRDVQAYLRRATGKDGAPYLPTLCIHGHTHIPTDEHLHGVRIINPGAAFRPRGGSARSLAVLEAAAGVITGLSFYPLR
jgi:putative phosphoesterase